WMRVKRGTGSSPCAWSNGDGESCVRVGIKWYLLLQAMLRVLLSILPYATGCPKVLVCAWSTHARDQYSGGRARLCLLSDYPVIPTTTAELDYHLSSVRHYAMALVQQGHQVYWLLSTESLQSFQAEPALASAAADVLPPTCRYIVPVQPYECAGV